MKTIIVSITIFLLTVMNLVADYAVIVSEKANADPDWKRVAEALRKKHSATVITYTSNVIEALPKLREQFPRYACFVATPAEAGREFVADVHRLTRRLDDDPYTDVFWGILTGYDATAALRIVNEHKPLTVRTAAAGTNIPLDFFEEGIWCDEGRQSHGVRKEKNARPVDVSVPPDTTSLLARSLSESQTDLFVTSGHATERDWQIGYSYRNGQFRCENGSLYGLDTRGQKTVIQSANPKVYLPVGNCLMGHVDGRDAMAVAFMNSGGVNQMIGYTVNTWYGYSGWGVLDYFVEQPGRYTLSEAFFANHTALLHRLSEYFPDLLRVEFPINNMQPFPRVTPQLTDAARAAGLRAQDGIGLLYDRDVVAFYGDPAWEARLAKQDLPWEQTLIETHGNFTFEVKPLLGEKSFGLTNGNGSQRGNRPFIHFFPRRLRDFQITEGEDLRPVLTDDFILVPRPTGLDGTKPLRVVFRAQKGK